jgi:xylulokinase
VAGFADGSGRYLPLACTWNGAPVLAAIAGVLGCDLERLSDLALSAPPGTDGLVLVPYLAGERTPNLPTARGELSGMSLTNTTPAHLARAAVEGILCGLADGVDAVVANGVKLRRILLVGGAARSPAVQQVAATLFDAEVHAPAKAEYVALGAARQAACAHAGGAAPGWPPPAATIVDGRVRPEVRAQYRAAADRVASASGRP